MNWQDQESVPGVSSLALKGRRTTMTHIAFQEQLDGVAVNWLEKVTDEQYQLKK
jgi:hypothetical protein